MQAPPSASVRPGEAPPSADDPRTRPERLLQAAASVADQAECSGTTRMKEKLPPMRWARVVARAKERIEILARVETVHLNETLSWRAALEKVAPEVGWSRYLHWRRCADTREGAPWERQLDQRAPPEPYRLSEEVRNAACLLRRADPTITCQKAQDILVAQFAGERGNASATSLKRIWNVAGLAQPRGRRALRVAETVQRFHGGAGLALIAAAAVETKVTEELARAVTQHANEVVSAQREVPPREEPAGRDDAGRFTAEYNRAVRGDSEMDPRTRSDDEKRSERRLGTLSLVRASEEVVGQKLLAMGLMPLLTERRGFDGLDGPAGAWLGVLGGTAYKAATLDRALGELALLNVGGSLWGAHGRHWAAITRPWSEAEGKPRWLRWAIYVDATQEPFWTDAYAMSGKVSHVGRVMPCLTRVAITGGPGVPLLVETRAGTVSLKKELLPALDRFEAVVGKGELGRLTIMDAEMATIPILDALKNREDRTSRWFITVLKGAVLGGADRSEVGEWQAYRERDQLREVRLRLHGAEAPADGLELRGVEMRRDGSRHPHPTLFVTDASIEELGTLEVPTAYLSRWPHQEQRFRDGRNGLGLDRTHGYGGSWAVHVALQTSREKADHRERRMRDEVAKIRTQVEDSQTLAKAVSEDQRVAAQDNTKRAIREQRQAEKRLIAAEKEKARLATTPREIFVRDTTRDSIVTCMKLTVLMLIEFVLKEYFGGARMEVRTFIEEYVHLPVTVRCRARDVIYQFESNRRDPTQAERLRAACDEVTRRGIVRGGRRLRFEVLATPPSAGS